MISLDEEDTISLLSDLIGKNARNCFRRLVRNETKPEKFETRILCLCDFRIYIILIKNNKPSKIELQFHFFDIKRLESLSKTQLFILTNDNRELKIAPFEGPSDFIECIYSEIDDFHELSVIDEIISYCSSNLLNIYPSVTIKDLIDTVNIQPEKRLKIIYNDIFEMKKLKKKLQICGCFSKSYSVHCNYIGMNCFQEVIWDVNLIYGQNGLTEFSLNDFDYVNPKDSVPLISALRYNSWFEGFHSDGIKLTHEMQDELAKVLSLPMCNIQNITLIHTNLKSDFLQRILNAFQASKSFKQYSLISSTNGITTNSFTSFKSINLTRNSIEDKGLNSLSNLFKEFSILCNLNSLVLSRCSISTKSLNTLFSSISVANKLKHLDLSFNNLKEEPVEFYKYLSEPNDLIDLNLSHTELDVDKFFNTLSRGGCDKNLKKLVLSGIHTFNKISNMDALGYFMRSVQSLTHFDLASAKLPGLVVQAILSNLKQNVYISGGFYLNLNNNDLGSCLKLFMYEFMNNESLTALDLSENNLDHDSDILISQLQHSKVRSLSLSRNFHNTKSKIIHRIILALTTWAVSKYTTLQKLWLIDCRLRSHLNDFINELGSFSHLRLLDISGNDIGDIGINYLSKSLQVNRSLQHLMFDRSNVSVIAYANIIEAIKRNYTLKSIQIPISDVCNLYQKSPEKVNDIAKQMTELFSHRKLLLNAQNKCDLDQLFKAKMKLINEPFAATTSLNSHSIPRSPSHSTSTINNNNQKSNDNENSSDLHAVNKINTPQYIKEILQNLNESSSNYLNEKSIEKQFAHFSAEILEKIDDVTLDLEKELNSTLRKKYPNYTSNQSLLNEKDKLDVFDLNTLKNNINDYMNSMLVQIHNDICEMTYKMSATMAEKLINESQKNPSNFLSSSKNTNISHQAVSPGPKNTISELESVLSSRNNDTSASDMSTPGKKPPNGGVKCLPFLPAKSAEMNNKFRIDNDNNNETGSKFANVQQRFELTTNSKSKRPISSQLQETIPSPPPSNTPSNTPSYMTSNNPQSMQSPRHRVIGFLPIKQNTNGALDAHNKSMSSSNENLDQSEDELDSKKDVLNGQKPSNPSSREKTPEMFHNELEHTLVSKHNKALPPLPVNLHHEENTNLSKSPIDNEIGFKKFNKSNSSESEACTFNTPIPAPRKMNKPSLKSLLGLGSNHNSPSTPKENPSIISSSRIQHFSPSLSRKTPATVVTPAVTAPDQTPDIKLESIEETSSDPNRLQHINKSRPKRANVRKPTKNSQVKIDVEMASENLDTQITAVKEAINEAIEDTDQPGLSEQVHNELNKKNPSLFSNSNNQVKKNTVEQPKISLNILEGVKLRQTSKFKQADPNKEEESQTNNTNQSSGSNTTTSNTTGLSNPTNKLGNRFSMFEQQQSGGGFSAYKPSFSKKTEQAPIIESTNLSKLSETKEEEHPIQEQPAPVGKISKPLPPLPPQKPPRPVFNSQLANKQNTNKDDSHQPSMLVKLRPVQTNINNNNNNNNNNNGNSNSNSGSSVNHKLNNELNTNIIFNTNHNNINSVHKNNNLIINENNCPNSNNNENVGKNGVQRLAQDSDKRASVRELAQMMFEESKA